MPLDAPVMTFAKLEALRLLALRPRSTSKQTAHGHISGRVAACLIREGLAMRAPQRWDGQIVPNAYEVQITDAGRAALEAAL